MSCFLERKEGREEVVVRSLECSRVVFRSKPGTVGGGPATGEEKLHVARALGKKHEEPVLLCQSCYKKPYRENFRHQQGKHKADEDSNLLRRHSNTNHRYMSKSQLLAKIDELLRKKRNNAVKDAAKSVSSKCSPNIKGLGHIAGDLAGIEEDLAEIISII